MKCIFCKHELLFESRPGPDSPNHRWLCNAHETPRPLQFHFSNEKFIWAMFSFEQGINRFYSEWFGISDNKLRFELSVLYSSEYNSRYEKLLCVNDDYEFIITPEEVLKNFKTLITFS